MLTKIPNWNEQNHCEKEITFLRNLLKQMEQIHANQQHKQQEQEKRKH